MSPPITGGTTATTPTRPQTGSHWSEGWARLEELERRVYKEGTHVLPGNTLNADFYIPLLQKALRSSTISSDQYSRMMSLLRFGATLFIDRDYLTSKLPLRIFRRNYPTAYENKAAVSEAIVQNDVLSLL